MTLHFQILGSPGRDNAALITIDSGQAVSRLLFDCGDGCLSELSFSEISSIDHLFFSHFHMDHISGFDSFLRCNYGRTDRPNHIWGPFNTTEVIQHRFQGYWWNLTAGMPGTWRLHNVLADRIATSRIENSEHFSVAHDEGSALRTVEILSTQDYSVEAVLLNHHGPSVAYLVREKGRMNLDTSRLPGLGLKPGAWVRKLKEATDDQEVLSIEGKDYRVEELRKELLVETPGDSIAYVTDFLLDAATHEVLVQWLSGCGTLICEAQYRHSDLKLAEKNYHTTTSLVAAMAKDAMVKQLLLFHLSDRYTADVWKEMLAEARAVFPAAQFTPGWNLEEPV